MRYKTDLVTLALAAGLLGTACEGEILPPATEVIGAAEPTEMLAPPRAGWEPVADALVATCGTLDCHGQAGRNLRLFGSHGLRLGKADDPGGDPTTDAEYQASYWSTVGLEPEILDAVVRADGRDPERLMVVRKGRGTIKHKGGTLVHAGDALDDCLLLWLRGTPDRTRCQEAHPQRPGAEPEPPPAP